VQNYDFAMTALDLAGVQPPAPVFDAASLRPYFDGGSAGPERTMYCSTTPILGCSMVRRANLKYLWSSAGGAEMLFDLAEDPMETRSMAGDPRYAQAMEQLRQIFRDCISRKVPELPDFNG
jgi:arylsulfatase A-like enzyme